MKFETKLFKSVASVVMGLAIAFLMLPALKTNAATTVLAAPKDARQCEATVDGVKVVWTGIPGATAYLYSWSADKVNYSQEAFTGNNGTDTSVGIVNSSWAAATTYYVKVRAFNGSSYSEPVVVTTSTAPKAPTYLKQTYAENTKATISWDASAGATGYLIRVGLDANSAKDISTVTSKTLSVTLTGLQADKRYYVAVYPVRYVTATYQAMSLCVDDSRIVTTAPAVTGLKLLSWDTDANIVNLQWKNSAKNESGYQVEIASPDGKKVLKTYNIYGWDKTNKLFTLKTIKNTPFQYRVRTYTLFSGKKSYGEWSKPAYATPQANVKATKVSDSSVKLTWDKVVGAKEYTIYRATTEGGKYKKVATVKKNYYTASNLALNTDYFYYVKANKVKLGGKYRNSTTVTEINATYIYIRKYSNDVVVE